MRRVTGLIQIAVVGAAACDEETAELARAVGAGLARDGAALVCGGSSGVMEAACRGAREAGGRTIGVLPGVDAAASPPGDFLDVVLYSGLGEARHLTVVLSAASVIAIGGGWGTLAEIAAALKSRVPVVALRSWNLRRPDGLADPLLAYARTPEDAVTLALRSARRERPVAI
ncbi:MAG: TIGR00725 family protein [Thermoanaerobaculia bacterium]|jgi:uncharacterized protein (TIGR00725 family)|nr:MAG: TIGR00725 family protein [Thermoanaerobaculia bacterium]MBZ0102456.1 TIGR00725 family protein [Thermoanaerobaculia bacterium]